MSEGGSVEVVLAGHGVPAFGRLSVSTDVVIILLKIETDSHVGGRGDAEVRPWDSKLHRVASSDRGSGVDEVRGIDLEGDGGRVALTFDDLSVVSIVSGGMVVVSINVDFYAVVTP